MAIETEATGIAALGLDWKLFLSQIVNFIILFWLLKKFAYQAILKVLDERRKKVEHSLQTAKLIEKRELELSEKEKAIIQKANRQASEFLDKSKRANEEMKQRLLDQIQGERLATKTKLDREMLEMKEQMILDAKKELAALVTAASKRVLSKVIDPNLNEKLTQAIVKESIHEIQNN